MAYQSLTDSDPDCGYAWCACRDCFFEVIGHDLCAYCEESDCDDTGKSECNASEEEGCTCSKVKYDPTLVDVVDPDCPIHKVTL